MIIRRALQKDMRPILDLCGKFSTSPYLFDRRFREIAGENRGIYPAFAEHMLKGQNAFTLVAEESPNVIGFITAAPNLAVSAAAGRNISGILLMAVNEQYRDRGVAKKLVHSALKVLFHAGTRLVTVITDLYNYPAVRVYESFGFRFAQAFHIYRHYTEPGDDTRGKALNRNIDRVSQESLDGFCARFDRPISLLKERSLDTERLRAYFAGNLKSSILKGRTAAFQYYQKNRPAGLINVMADEIAAKAARTEQKIYKIMDLIVPDRMKYPDIERKMLQDVLARMENYRMMEIWIDSENTQMVFSAEKAGYHLSYTGVAYHLSR